MPHAPVMASIKATLVAPGLLRYEIASISATKLQRQPKHAKS